MNGHVPERDQENIECNVLLQRKREEESPPNLNEPLVPGAHTPDQNTRNLNSCSQIVFWKCKLWMVLISVFVVVILVIILSTVLYSAVYIDEDEYWDAELIASGIHHNFSGMLNICCANDSDPPLSASAYTLLSENLSKRFTDVYSNSPALGRYFISAEVSFSDKNNTASYHLCFSVPPETEEFMKYRMSKEFLMNILRQNIYDQEEIYGLVIPGCTNMTLDPTSGLLTSPQPTAEAASVVMEKERGEGEGQAIPSCSTQSNEQVLHAVLHLEASVTKTLRRIERHVRKLEYQMREVRRACSLETLGQESGRNNSVSSNYN